MSRPVQVVQVLKKGSVKGYNMIQTHEYDHEDLLGIRSLGKANFSSTHSTNWVMGSCKL